MNSDIDALLLNKEELSALLKEGIKPKWWDANKHRVTYDLISTLLHLGCNIGCTNKKPRTINQASFDNFR